MNSQSKATTKPQQRGTLYMLSTHIGNAMDIPQRSLDLVKTVDLMIFEEDKPARAVLKLAQLTRNYAKFSEHHQKETIEQLQKCLKNGQNAAYMSDQGCPTFSDPGAELLKAAFELSASVKTVPGPSSLSSALACCPFTLKQFFFQGFLPREKELRRQALTSAAKRKEGLVIMDTPYRLKATLGECAAAFRQNRKAFIALDISGDEEQYFIGTFKQLQQKLENVGKKLNFVLIVEADKKARPRT